MQEALARHAIFVGDGKRRGGDERFDAESGAESLDKAGFTRSEVTFQDENRGGPELRCERTGKGLCFGSGMCDNSHDGKRIA